MQTIWRSKRNLSLIGLIYLALAAWFGLSAMHIPDGYLSPLTSLVMFGLVLPFWVIGIRKIRTVMDARSVPVIALVAAFSFVIMMFNVPLPGGTSGHAVGAALAAILLGPEIAVIAVSIALMIQAVFFGDGGILAIGANSFNMAVVIPYVAYAIYRLVTGSQIENAWRRSLGAFLGGYIGLTAGAFLTAVEFGLQPIFFKAADGSPLYAPYPLAISIPAMVIPHMLVASVIEGLVTALVLAFVIRTNPGLLKINPAAQIGAPTPGRHRLGWLAGGLVALALIVPLGLLAPGTAWGEWGASELSAMGLQSVPAGMASLEGLWGAPLAGYNVPALGNASLGYILSAVVGILVVILVVWLFTMLLTRRAPAAGD
jgi:cobalt/nickel transport system permease protein